jgi:predicted nucleic acid-binding Zn ribbon protein
MKTAEEKREKLKIYVRKRREKLAEKGLCVNCAAPLPANRKSKVCQTCQEKMNGYRRRKNAVNVIKCPCCGEQLKITVKVD